MRRDVRGRRSANRGAFTEKQLEDDVAVERGAARVVHTGRADGEHDAPVENRETSRRDGVGDMHSAERVAIDAAVVAIDRGEFRRVEGSKRAGRRAGRPV